MSITFFLPKLGPSTDQLEFVPSERGCWATRQDVHLLLEAVEYHKGMAIEYRAEVDKALTDLKQVQAMLDQRCAENGTLSAECAARGRRIEELEKQVAESRAPTYEAWLKESNARRKKLEEEIERMKGELWKANEDIQFRVICERDFRARIADLQKQLAEATKTPFQRAEDARQKPCRTKVIERLRDNLASSMVGCSHAGVAAAIVQAIEDMRP